LTTVHYQTLSQHCDISINSLKQMAFMLFPAGHSWQVGSSYIPP
jgi:hypothetical protein